MSHRADDAPIDHPKGLEALMFRPVPLWTVLLTALAGLWVAGALAGVARTPEKHGALGQAVLQLAAVPQTLKGLTKHPKPYAPRKPSPYAERERWPDGFWRDPAPAVTDPGHALITVYAPKRQRAVIRLIRLSDGKLLREYAPDIDAVNARSTFQSALVDLRRDRNLRRALPMHPLLMANGDVLIHDTGPLARIDPCGRVVWVLDGIYHHAVEPGLDGHIWAAYRYPKALEPGVGPAFADEAIVELSADGKVLRRERIADILDRNQLGYLWRSRPYTDDPFHLNDIQPVLRDGPYWRRGDLLLSLRNLSTLMLYRPSTGQVLWRRERPWTFQHDVNILDDHRLSVFDNHWVRDFAQDEQARVDGVNRLLVYDFANDTVSAPFEAGFVRNNISTRAQGRATPLPNGDFMIEETEQGRLMRMAPDGAVRWRYISADAAMRRFQLRWSRYLPPGAFDGAIQAAEHARCD